MERGILERDDIDRIWQWFSKHNVDVKCPICNTSDLTPVAVICPTKYDLTAVFVIGEEEWPMIQIVCDNCGFVLPFDARRILNLPDKRTGLITSNP